MVSLSLKRRQKLRPTVQYGPGGLQTRVWSRQAIRGQRGAAAVEFALVLPLLLVLLWGTIEFGFMMFDKAMITNASREAARAAVVHQTPKMTVGDIRDKVTAYCTNLVSFGGEAAVQVDVPQAPPTDPATASGQQLTVNVTYNYTTLVLARVMALLPSGTPGPLSSGSITLTAATTMTHE